MMKVEENKNGRVRREDKKLKAGLLRTHPEILKLPGWVVHKGTAPEKLNMLPLKM